MRGVRALRSAAGVGVVLAVAGCAGDPSDSHEEVNDAFFGVVIALLLIGPCVLMMLLALRRAKTRADTLPRFDDDNFTEAVLENQMPVLVHFAREWNVANAAARSQTELLQWQNRGAVLVGVLDIDACPRVMERFPGLEPPAYLLFYQGRKLFHRPGLRQAGEIQDDIDRALSREGF